MLISSARSLDASNPLVALLTLLVGLVVLVLLIPLLLIGFAVGVVTVPAYLLYRSVRTKLAGSDRFDGRKNVRVIPPGGRDTPN